LVAVTAATAPVPSLPGALDAVTKAADADGTEGKRPVERLILAAT
jgi:hypothetical protein